MEVAPKWNWRALIKQDPHATASVSRLAAVCSRTVSTWALVTPGNHSRKSSTVAPSARFSKSARTGTRVPRNTQAPLTMLGERSTAEHVLQSIILNETYQAAEET